MYRDARVAIELLQHPLVREIRASLGPDAVLAVVGLMFWASGRQGRLGKLTPNRLAALSDYPGNRQQLFDGLIEHGLIALSGDEYVMPDWREFFPYDEAAERRRIAGRENARKRYAGRAPATTQEPPPPTPEPPRPAIKPPEADLFGAPIEPRGQRVPFEAIVNLYHKHLPDNPPVHKINDELRKTISARWKADKDRRMLSWWDYYFRYVATRYWLTGRDGQGGDGPFRASLSWLVGPKNMNKVINNEYAGDDDALD